MAGCACKDAGCTAQKCRIVSAGSIRVANGSKNIMLEKMKRLSAGDFLKPGDVIGVSRAGLYEHYGIWFDAGIPYKIQRETPFLFNSSIDYYNGKFQKRKEILFRQTRPLRGQRAASERPITIWLQIIASILQCGVKQEFLNPAR